MKRIGSRLRAGSKKSAPVLQGPRWAGAVSWLLLLTTTCAATTRPHYGGTLRVEMREQVASLDLRASKEDANFDAATEKLAALIYDRLIELDENGQPRAALAIEWRHDAEFKRWQFKLRPNVKCQDGVVLTANEVARWWQLMNGPDRQASITEDWLWIQSEQPMPDLPRELAEGRKFVFRLGADGTPIGTGPFRLTGAESPGRWIFTANEDYWGGRPFVDGISVEMGVSAAQQMIDLALGRADLVEVAPEQALRAGQSGRKLASSEAVELLALIFDASKPAASDVRLRHAISLAVDREAICNVLLQRQGWPAGGLLPQWLTGYAFLFGTATDLDGARGLARQLRPSAKPLTLGYEAGDRLAQTLAERVALNARDAAINIQVIEAAPGSADAQLVRIHLPTLHAARALASFASMVRAPGTPVAATEDDPEKLYAAERALLDDARVVPLAYLPETVGLSAQVRDWLPRRWGEWKLADVWLDTASAQGAPSAGGARQQ